MARATRATYTGTGTDDSMISALATVASGKNPDGTDVGALPYFNAALLATKAAARTVPGRLAVYHIYNPNTVDIFVQFFDLALADVTVGSTTPTWVFWVPAGGALDTPLAEPIVYAVALTIAATTTATGSTAPGTGLMTNLFYN